MSRDITLVQIWDTAQTVATTGVLTSSAINQHLSHGFCSLLVILAGTTPSVDITYTVGASSGATFYAPFDRDGNSLGTLATTLTATRWISFSPVVAPEIKIVVTGDGSNGTNTTVRAYLIFPEEV